MLLIISIINFLICSYIVYFEYKKKSVALFFWTICLIMFCLPSLIDSVYNTNYPNWVIIRSILFTMGFEIVYLLFRILLCKRNNYFSISDELISSKIEKEDRVLIRFFTICSVVFLVFICFYFFFRFGSISNLTWGSIYEASINASTSVEKILEFIRSIMHILYFAISGILLYSLYKKKRLLSLFLIVNILLYLTITRNRIVVLPLLTSVIILYIFKNKKLKLKNIISLFVVGLFFVYMIYAVWVFRHAGTLSTFIHKYTFGSFNSTVLNSMFNGEGELGLKNIFYHFIYIDNNFPGLSRGSTYIRILLMLVPNKLCFGIKPGDFAITMASAYMNNVNNTVYSVHPTFFGDLFANFGYFGFTLGFVWAIVFKFIDKCIVKKKKKIIRLNMLVLWSSSLIIIARGSVYNGFFIGVIGSIFLAVIDRIHINNS